MLKPKCIFLYAKLTAGQRCISNTSGKLFHLLVGWFYANSSQASKRLPHLIHKLQVREEGDVLGPLNGAEEQSGRQLADVLNAHQVVPLHALGPVARCGVGLGAQQQRNEAGQVRLAVVRVCAVSQVLSGAGLGV